MRNWPIYLVIICGAAVISFSLLIKPEPAADLRYPIFNSPRSIDPARGSWSEDLRLVRALWEGLAGNDPVDTHPVSAGASLPPDLSEDKLVYTFHLRSDARWSNGDPVVAGDYIYGWRRAIEPGSSGEYVFLLTDYIAGAGEYSAWRHEAVRILKILRMLANGRTVNAEDERFIKDRLTDLPVRPGWKTIFSAWRQQHLDQIEERFGRVGLKAVDDYTLQVTLVRPTAYFVDLAAFPTYMPIHQRSLELLRENNDPVVTDLTLWVFDPQWTKLGWHRNGYPGLITNGPFKMAEMEFKRYIKMDRNEFYWDAAGVRLKSVLIRIIPDPGGAFMAYEKGDLDFMRNLDVIDYAPALWSMQQQGLRHDIPHCNSFGTYFYKFNCQATLPDGSPNPFYDARVRMAFALAVNKRDIADKVKKNGVQPARTLIPVDVIPGYVSQPGPDFNPELARALLRQAGYPQGKGLPTITILYNTDQNHEKVAEAVARMWEENLGVQVDMQGKETKTFDDDRIKVNYMVTRHGWYGDYMDPTTFLDMFMTGNGQNDNGYANNQFDRMMTEAAATLDAAKRLQLLSGAERYINQEQVPVLTLFYYVNLLAVRENVKGFYPNAREINPLKYVYIERAAGPAQ